MLKAYRNIMLRRFKVKTRLLGLIAILLSISVPVLADPQIEYQKKTAAEEIEAAKKAKPEKELRPAATTHHKKHSVESHKANIIKHQIKEADKEITDTEAASPEVEARPAATTNQK
jgi:hypothetical protein